MNSNFPLNLMLLGTEHSHCDVSFSFSNELNDVELERIAYGLYKATHAVGYSVSRKRLTVKLFMDPDVWKTGRPVTLIVREGLEGSREEYENLFYLPTLTPIDFAKACAEVGSALKPVGVVRVVPAIIEDAYKMAMFFATGIPLPKVKTYASALR